MSRDDKLGFGAIIGRIMVFILNIMVSWCVIHYSLEYYNKVKEEKVVVVKDK